MYGGANLIRRAIPKAIRKSIRVAAESVRFGAPEIVIHYGRALGDDLLCTAVLRELNKRGCAPWIVSNHSELFADQGDAARVIPVYNEADYFARLYGSKFKKLEYAKFDLIDRSEPPMRHIISELCASAGLEGDIALRPHFKLPEKENSDQAWARGWIAIQSSGLGGPAPMQNKQWFVERFQSVVDLLSSSFDIVQLGSRTDPPLLNVKDLRGVTTVRETSAILANARLYIGAVGFLMHLARAVDCPSVVVFGGREAPWQSGYACNVNLFTAVECAPCWRWNTCDFDRICMRAIKPGDVVRGVEQLLDQSRNELSVEICKI
jgi:hypothetical protein